VPVHDSGSVHLHIQDGNPLAGDDGQIQRPDFLDLSLLTLGDIASDGLGYTLHRFCVLDVQFDIHRELTDVTSGAQVVGAGEAHRTDDGQKC
jgi:hypothetical protein